MSPHPHPSSKQQKQPPLSLVALTTRGFSPSRLVDMSREGRGCSLISLLFAEDDCVDGMVVTSGKARGY